MGTGAAFGAWMSGWLRDTTGSYEAGLLFAAVMALLGLSQFWIIPALARGAHTTPLTASEKTAIRPLGDDPEES